MKVYENGTYRDMTAAEIAAMEAEQAQAECRYWADVPYDEAVNSEIRTRYSISQDFAILRQKDEKPDEYAEYYAYCEQCKTYVKQMKG